jgi:hypothetical protein
MSLTRLTYLLITGVLLWTVRTEAQTFSDQGLMSGSGLNIIPTAVIAPPYEYRLQVSRISYLDGSKRGMNVFGLAAGLSTTLEGYLRFGSEQSGSFTSQASYGFGGKFRMPMLFPVVRRVALWADFTSTDQTIPSALFPSDAFRTGVTATFDSNGIHPTMLFGMAKINGRTNLLIGTGATLAEGNSKQFGLELVYGYLGKNSAQIVSTGAMRVFSNIGIHVSPGYLSSPSGSAWFISLGFSLSTTDIDFHRSVEEKKEDEFILPSIEEMEKNSQSNGNKEPSGSKSGTNGLEPVGGITPNQIEENGSKLQGSEIKGSLIQKSSHNDQQINKQQEEKKRQEKDAK